MPTIQTAIVYHSNYGHTAKLAKAIQSGLQSVHGTSVMIFTTDEAPSHWDDLEKSDAIIFGCPTYMGNVSAAFQNFMEATSKAVMAKNYTWQNKLAAGFTNSGAQSGDKLSTLIQLSLYAAQHGMHWINLALPPANNSTAGSHHDLNRLGFWLGAAAQSNVDQSADMTPPHSDLLTAKHLGKRVAEVAHQLKRGCLN